MHTVHPSADLEANKQIVRDVFTAIDAQQLGWPDCGTRWGEEDEPIPLGSCWPERRRRCAALSARRAPRLFKVDDRKSPATTRIVGVRAQSVAPFLASRERGVVGLHSAAGAPGANASQW